MPSFTYLSEQYRRDVVQYIKQLTTSTNERGERVNIFEQAGQQGVKSVEIPPEPPVTLQALTKGKEVFARVQCAACHGETGAGDGPNAQTLRDTWGLPLPPRDFNTGAFRGGHTGRDLYLRIHNGLAGTPMPPFGPEVMNAEERWALVLYIQSLRRKDIEVNDFLPPPDGTIIATRVSQVPSDVADRRWDKMDPARVPLNPLWPEKDPIPAVAVRAVHDGKRLAVLCQWRDYLANGAPIRVQDFQDAIALQFSLTGGTPFLGMGDPANPVNIWQWKAGWQQEIAGTRPDMREQYVSMYSDIYPEAGVLYRTAEASGNLMSVPHRSSVEDANASGFGTLTSQPVDGQNVKGTGVWRDSHWSVLFIRELRSRETADVKFTIDKPVPMAFAIWDGQNRDRNGRKVVSNWYQLKLEN
jgi:mono/diheme cytochrome c family protein